jgi:hypothetical protein
LKIIQLIRGANNNALADDNLLRYLEEELRLQYEKFMLEEKYENDRITQTKLLQQEKIDQEKKDIAEPLAENLEFQKTKLE